jgi:protein-disulfide isomerase
MQFKNKLIPVLVVLVIIAAFFIGSLYTKVQMLEKGTTNTAQNNNGQVAGTGNQAPQVQPTPGPVDITIGSADPILGNASAKITLVEFTDFQCPFCKSLADNAMVQVKKDYVDTGKAKLIVRNFPLPFHEFAQKSAEAAECAKEQNKFFVYYDKLFANQDKLTVDDLKKYAADLGLNTANFNSCLDNGKMAYKVKSDTALGTKAGVQGTPSVFVGTMKGDTFTGTQVSGAVPFDVFKTAIDSVKV